MRAGSGLVGGDTRPVVPTPLVCDGAPYGVHPARESGKRNAEAYRTTGSGSRRVQEEVVQSRGDKCCLRVKTHGGWMGK